LRKTVIATVLICLVTVVVNTLGASRGIRLRDDFYWEVDATEDEQPESAENQPAHHGPAVVSAATLPSIKCQFALWGNGDYYNLGFEARLTSPLETPISYAAAAWYKPVINGITGGEVIEDEYGTYLCTVDFFVDEYYVGAGSAGINVKPICNNSDQQAVVDEYYNDTCGVTLKPACSDVVSSGGSGHFSWSPWMVGQTGTHAHGGWGIGSVFTEIETVRTNYLYRDEIRIESGYRCPVHNAEITPQGAADSRHMHRKAVDLLPVTLAWNQTERNSLATAAENAHASWVEPWGNGYQQTMDHVHAQW